MTSQFISTSVLAKTMTTHRLQFFCTSKETQCSNKKIHTLSASYQVQADERLRQQACGVFYGFAILRMMICWCTHSAILQPQLPKLLSDDHSVHEKLKHAHSVSNNKHGTWTAVLFLALTNSFLFTQLNDSRIVLSNLLWGSILFTTRYLSPISHQCYQRLADDPWLQLLTVLSNTVILYKVYI